MDRFALTSLAAYEKSLDYAQSQLDNSEILDAKLTLDQIANNLDLKNFENRGKEIMEYRERLEKRMEELREDYLLLRRRSFRKRSVA